MPLSEFDLRLDDGDTLHVYDTGDRGPAGPRSVTVMWHHGTPNIGTPPAPLFAASDKLGIRWVSYDRPGYGNSTPRPGRSIASAAAYATRVADALGIKKFAVMGHSGGGSHAIACGALLPDRVLCAVSVAGLAPIDAEGLDWFEGMFSGGAKLHAAVQGRAALEENMRHSAYDPEMFTPSDHAALRGAWGWFHEVVGPAMKSGPEGQIEDDLAYTRPWGTNLGEVTIPVFLLHGNADRIAPSAHAKWLAGRISNAEISLHHDDGHISILNHSTAALEWICAHAVRD